MARLTTRQKNFGMAKAVKKSPIQKLNNGKSFNKPAQQLKKSPPNRQPAAAKQNQKSEVIPKARSTQSILKRELARKTTENSAKKDSGGSGRKTTPKVNESVPSESSSLGKIVCGQANAKTDELRKAKVDQQKISVQSNSSGDTSPSIFNESSKSMYQALEYPQCPDSTVLSSDLLANAFNDVVINSADRCPKSPDLFETESMEDDTCIDSAKLESQKEKAEMVSTSVQCKLSLENRVDAQVGTDNCRIKMVDVGIQTDPLPPCATCQTNASCDSNGFTNFDEIDESDDSYDSYESDSSYDHCLDNFDCLEHLDDDGSLYRNTTNHNGNERDRPRMNETNEAEPVISESPPRYQIYRDRRFHSPDSLELNTTKKNR